MKGARRINGPIRRNSGLQQERTGLNIQFVPRESYQEIVEGVLAGRLEAAWICGFPYVRHRARLRLLAIPLYRGAPSYRAYLIRHRRSADAVTGWATLRDRVLACSDPWSNSGWLVAQDQLHAAGVPPAALRRSFFTWGHRHVAEAVATGLAHAGAIDGYVWDTLVQQGSPVVDGTEVVWRSPPYGFPPLVAGSGTAPPVVQMLRDALAGMATDAAGLALLHDINLDGFTGGTPDMYNDIAQMATRVLARQGQG